MQLFSMESKDLLPIRQMAIKLIFRKFYFTQFEKMKMVRYFMYLRQCPEKNISEGKRKNVPQSVIKNIVSLKYFLGMLHSRNLIPSFKLANKFPIRHHIWNIARKSFTRQLMRCHKDYFCILQCFISPLNSFPINAIGLSDIHQKLAVHLYFNDGSLRYKPKIFWIAEMICIAKLSLFF